MAYGYITKLNENVARTHVRYNNRYGIAIATDLYDRVDRIPFDRLEAFFKENLK